MLVRKYGTGYKCYYLDRSSNGETRHTRTRYTHTHT